MLQKSDGAIRNGQHRDTGNIGTQDTGRRQANKKNNKNKNKNKQTKQSTPQQKTTKMGNTDSTKFRIQTHPSL